MSGDRRLTPFSGRVAHRSLAAIMPGVALTDGRAARIGRGVVDLDRAQAGARDRQLIWGDRVLVIDEDRGRSFVMAEKDGYCGWLDSAALGPDLATTHRVVQSFSQIYPLADFKERELATLPMGAQVQVLAEEGRFALTPSGHVPLAHLRRLDTPETDPVAVASRLLGAPYLWGGNSGAGIDCSGLAQAAMLACGVACRGDSDLQSAQGVPVAPGDALIPGDLVFWKGHVALVSGPDEIIHATAAFMAVVRESLSGAIARIEAQGGGPVTHRRRLMP